MLCYLDFHAISIPNCPSAAIHTLASLSHSLVGFETGVFSCVQNADAECLANNIMPRQEARFLAISESHFIAGVTQLGGNQLG